MAHSLDLGKRLDSTILVPPARKSLLLRVVVKIDAFRREVIALIGLRTPVNHLLTLLRVVLGGLGAQEFPDIFGRAPGMVLGFCLLFYNY